MTGPAQDGSGKTPRPEGMDPTELAAVKQLSREVLILEMLKSELLERNARLERWHAEHPRTSASQSGSSQAPRHSFELANAGAPGSSGEAFTSQPLPSTEAAPPRASSRGRDRSNGDRRVGSLLPR
ncbi:g5209 [Coccomyxa elongata]